MRNITRRPLAGDFPAYYEPYLARVPEGDLLEFLENQKTDFVTFIRSIPAEKGNFRYAEGKWTVKEVLGHIIDTERIMAYRALAFSRKEHQSIPGFDENTYVENSESNRRSLESLADEFESLRAANLELFASFSAKQLDNIGIANGRDVTVNALVYIIAGHLEHHLQVLKDRYGL